MLLNCVAGDDSWGRLLDSKEIQPVNPQENQFWIFTGKTDAEDLILWPPDVKSPFIGKNPDAVKDWGLEEKGMTEDEMVGWHHRLSGHGFEQTLGETEGQAYLVCCRQRCHKESDVPERLNENNKVMVKAKWNYTHKAFSRVSAWKMVRIQLWHLSFS